MLTVSRQEGESIVIGDPRNPIGTVRVARIRGRKVSLSFQFAKNMPVNRAEVVRRIAAARR